MLEQLRHKFCSRILAQVGVFCDARHCDHKVKRMVVHPGHRLSYQRHAHRAEHWFVVSGAGVVTLDGTEVAVTTGTAVDVPRGSAHRITNTGDVDLVFVEVQHGDSFAEEDIERLEDDYGRSV